jgi:hypothetical protein
MKSIITREESEKKTKRNQLIMGIILILIMTLSTVGYALSTKESESEIGKLKYNGIEFVKESDYWYFNFQGKDFITKYNPKETENASAGFVYSKINDFADEPLYFVGNFQEANFELKRNLYAFALRMQDACIKSINCSSDSLPVKNCSSDNVIIIQESENKKESIYQENKCVFIFADMNNQTMYADALLFKIMGI